MHHPIKVTRKHQNQDPKKAKTGIIAKFRNGELIEETFGDVKVTE